MYFSSFAVNDLSPGTEYKLTVIPVRNGTAGSPTAFSFSTKGKALPKVAGLSLDLGSSSKEKMRKRKGGQGGQGQGGVKIKWTPLEKGKDDEDWVYGVYTGKSVQELMNNGKCRI
jgi:hypothetical protein